MSEAKLNEQNFEPAIPASSNLPEMTWRALIIGTILTIVLAAANAYLGLKVGQTISASIPAAIISMSILRFFRQSNMLENTMVQTMASVGEALISGMTFILPALVILHAWDRFYYWQTVFIGLLGGTLGVLFTIPLRRALLMDKTLRYPEGVAIANVLKANAAKENGDSKELAVGGLVGATISLFQGGFQVLTDTFQYWVKTTHTIFGFGLGLSPALIAAGYIVGINVGISLLVGIFIGWIAGIPILTWVYGIPTDGDTVNSLALIVWRSHMRYIGVGTMLLGALWTLLTLIRPIVYSISSSFKTLQQAKVKGAPVTLRTERDIPINYVFWGVILLLVPIFILIMQAIIPENVAISNTFRICIGIFSTLYVLIGGFVFCSVSSYFAGLIGSTNTPVSGLLVSALLVFCLTLLLLFGFVGGVHGKEMIGVVLAIGSTVMIGAAIGISNDTMQDLKVGQLLGATPWKQQVMLMVGVLITAFIIPPIFDLLFNAYGIGGVFPRPDMNKTQMLAAPQAGLMAAVAQGVYTHNLEWGMIGVGAIIAFICIIIDEFLKPRGNRLPVLAVGLGIYLPLDSSVPIVIGGILSYIVQQRLKRYYDPRDVSSEAKIVSHRHRGLLLACGIVAGSSIMGVLLAIPFAIKQRTDALRIMPDSLQPLAGILSIFVTFLLCAWIYRVVLKKIK